MIRTCTSVFTNVLRRTVVLQLLYTIHNAVPFTVGKLILCSYYLSIECFPQNLFEHS